MEKITTNEIKYACAHNFYPMTQAQFVTKVALKLIEKVPVIEVLKYPITYAREDYFVAAQKISDIFNTNKIIEVFGVSTFKGLNALHKKCMSAKQK